MKFYWTTRSIPELTQLPTEERKKVWQYHSCRCFQHRETWIGVLVIILLTLSGWLLGAVLTEDAIQKKAWKEVLGMFGGIVGSLLFMQIVVGVVRKRIRASRK